MLLYTHDSRCCSMTKEGPKNVVGGKQGDCGFLVAGTPRQRSELVRHSCEGGI